MDVSGCVIFWVHLLQVYRNEYRKQGWGHGKVKPDASERARKKEGSGPADLTCELSVAFSFLIYPKQHNCCYFSNVAGDQRAKIRKICCFEPNEHAYSLVWAGVERRFSKAQQQRGTV